MLRARNVVFLKIILVAGLTALLPAMNNLTDLPQANAQTKAITVVTGTDVETLDPHLTAVRNTEILTEAIYSGLVTRNERNEIVPDLATSWVLTGDKLAWTFKLRPDAKFSDGTPVTAAAVKFSFDRVQNPETKSIHFRLLSMIDRTEVVDERTVRIVTKTPFAPLLANLSDPGARILQPAAVEKWGKDYGQHPTGSGPYMLKEWIVGERVVLVRNPIYFGKRGSIETITFRAAKEGGARTATLASGQADIVTNIPPEAIARLGGMQEVKILAAPSSFLIYFVLDHTKKPFNDVRVRQAANLAVDRNAIVKHVLRGLGDAANSPVGQGVLGRAEFDPWPYDPARAKRLLSEAGYPEGVEIEIWAPQGRYLKDAETAEVTMGYLKAHGFRPRLQILEWGTYVAQVFRPQLPRNMWMVGTSIPDAYWNLLGMFHTKGFFPNGYSSRRVDELLDRASRTFDDASRQKIFADIQRIVFKEDTVLLFLHSQRQVIGSKKSIVGLNPLPFEIFYLSSLDVK